MSIDFNALFAIGRDFRGVAWLRDELAREPPGVREVVVRYRERWRVEEWLVEQPRHGSERIVGPGGFALHISAEAVELYHLIRFSEFTGGPDDERQVFRRACFAIAFMSAKVFDYSLFRATKEMLYLPLEASAKTIGKSIVDMGTYRAAKAGASLLLILLVPFGTVVVAGTGVSLAAVWLVCALAIAPRYRDELVSTKPDNA